MTSFTLPGVFRRALLVPAPLDEVTHGHRDRALTPLQTIHIVFLQNRIGCLNDTRRINREITSNKRKKKRPTDGAMQSAAAGPVGVGPNKREATAARTLKLQPVPTVFFSF